MATKIAKTVSLDEEIARFLVAAAHAERSSESAYINRLLARERAASLVADPIGTISSTVTKTAVDVASIKNNIELILTALDAIKGASNAEL